MELIITKEVFKRYMKDDPQKEATDYYQNRISEELNKPICDIDCAYIDECVDCILEIQQICY